MTNNLKARLVCLHMGDDNLIDDIELSRSEVYTVGRSSDSSIFLKLSDVSNKHAEFGYGGDAWSIIDCESTNGVYVNGKKISIKKLENGDEIQLGSALFCYKEDSRPGSFFLPRKIKYAALGLSGAVLIISGIFLYSLYPKESYVSKQPIAEPAYIGPDAESSLKIPRLTGEEILYKKSSKLQIYYNARNENVLILDFPTLQQHGLMFNRILAFAEGPGVSREVLLSDFELSRLIKKAKLTFETFAFGNDFMIEDIVGFFNLPNETSVKLNEEELRLQNILLENRFMIKGDNGKFKTTSVDKAVISITQLRPDDPATEIDELIDIDIRRALIMHELSHGEFFTNSAYREYCIGFWHYEISEIQRSAFRKMLSENSYDIENERLCINEMQAYLMNTPDKRLFSAASLEMTEDELSRIQQKFMAGNPPTNLYANGDSYFPQEVLE